MSTFQARKNAAQRFNLTHAKLLTTSALTAAGLLALGVTDAKAQNVAPDALPQGANVTQGSADFDYSGNTLTITQNADLTTAEYAGGFNIGRNAAVRMRQDISDLFVHIDRSANSSYIEGVFSGSGNNIVLNRNGVLVTGTARIDMNSFVTSTAGSIDTSRFADTGKIVFSDFGNGDLEIQSGARVSVADAGLVAMIGPFASNAGVINAKAGKVAFAAGEQVTLDLYGDGLYEVVVEGELADAVLENTGEINAEGGTVQMTALAAKDAVDNIINLDGVVTVASATSVGGKIVLSGGDAGVVTVAGDVDASGRHGGGSISVTGENVHVTETAELKAHGGQDGDGGQAYIYGNNVAIFQGRIGARGGVEAGHGGNAEVSAGNNVGFYGLVDLGADNGDVGTLIIDPEHLTISNAGFASDLAAILTLGELGTININDQALANALHNNNVNLWASETLSTGSDIDISEYDYEVLNTNGTWRWWLWTVDQFNGITQNNLTVAAPDVNLAHDITLGMGALNVADLSPSDSVFGFDIANPPVDIIVERLNLGGAMYQRAALVDPSFATLAADSQINTTADVINVLSSDAFINQAIQFADASNAQKETINVAAGTYEESVLVDRRVTLNGANAGTAGYDDERVAESVIVPNSPGIHVNADNVTIDGFTIDGDGTDVGVLVSDQRGVQILNTIIKDTTDGINAVVDHDNSVGTLRVQGNKIDDSNLNGIVIIGDGAAAAGDSLVGVKVDILDNEIGTDGDDANTDDDGVSGKGITFTKVGDIDDLVDPYWSEDATTSAEINVTGNAVFSADNAVEFAGGIDEASITIANNNDGFVSENENGIVFAGPITDTDLDIDANTIRAEKAGIRFDSEIGGSSTVDITNNTIGTDGDEVRNGIRFARISTATVNISGGFIDSRNDGIDFARGLDNGADVNIANMTIVSDGDEAIDVNQAVRSGSDISITGGSYTGANNGVEYSGTIAGTATITGATINGQGTDKRGVNLLGSITGLLDIADSTITGGDDGIGSNDRQNNTVNSGTFEVTGSTITGLNGDGIELGAIENAATVNISDNVAITGAAHGTHLVERVSGSTVNILNNTITGTNGNGVQVNDVDGSTVSVSDNTSITGGLNGIVISGALYGDATVTIDGNDSVEGVAEDGIYVRDTYRGGVTVEITNNTDMTAGRDGIRSRNVAGVLIDNNTVRDTGRHGVYASTSHGGVISNNTITDADENGILSYYTNAVDITDNTVAGTGTDGVQVAYGYGADILDNNVTAAGRDGVNVYANDYATIAGNTVYGQADRSIFSAAGSTKGAERDGIHVERSHSVVIDDNTVKGDSQRWRKDGLGAGRHGIYVSGGQTYLFGNGVQITNNKILGDSGFLHSAASVAGDGVHVTGNGAGLLGARPLVENNTIERTGGNGVFAQETDFVKINLNNIDITGKNGIHVSDTNFATITNNTVDFAAENGINVNSSNFTEIAHNEIHDVLRDAVKVTGGTAHFIHNNTIARTGDDGIDLEDFGVAWIAYNDIELTGDNGIQVDGGDFVSIYNNYVDLSGYLPGLFGNIKVNDEANGIYVENVGGDNIPSLGEEGYGFSYYGAAVEITGNDVANAADDGIQVVDSESAYIARNNVGHVGDDGIDVDDVNYVKISKNLVSLAEDKGITVDGGRYAGIFDNRVLLTGNDGIQVENIRYNDGDDFSRLGDDNYGYGWAVNVSGNQVAMTGDDGIEVRDSDATKVARNDVFMAGMGEDLGEEIATINDFADGTFNPFIFASFAPALAGEYDYDDYESFDWDWGNGHGINVHGIDGAYYSPNGWAADIRRNNVKYTGGHGILAQNNDRTRIARNTVRYAGVDYTEFGGAESMLDVLENGPFEGEARRDLWSSEGNMVEVLEGYFGDVNPDPEGPDYITVDYVEFDSHDGIHAENIYGYGDGGLSGANYLYDLVIKKNDVRITGDDGIEVVNAGRTLIARNTVRDAGEGSSYYYGSGDYYGADGIHVRNVRADVFNGYYGFGPGRNTGSESAENYALVIRGNDVRRTADDGIEVVGGEGYYGYYGYYGSTDRVLIKNNRIRNVGVGDYGYYGYYGADSFGADGIHVRGINGQTFGGPVWPVFASTSGENTSGFYGYAVDVIGNKVRRTGDDGIEVINSSSTLIANNKVRSAGVGYGYYYGGADYFGADGIHVRNVGDSRGSSFWPGQGEAGIGFEPYAVAIIDNNVRNTQDDGIEVVGGSGFFYDTRIGTGRTLIEGNTVANAGVTGYYGFFYGDGYGADGIHVRGVTASPFGPRGDIYDSENIGLPYGDRASVEIIGNDVDNVIDDGIQVLASGDTVIDDNTVSNTGMAESDGYYGYYGYGQIDRWGSDGIHVRNGFLGEGGIKQPRGLLSGSYYGQPYFLLTDVEITNNTVSNAADDGIEVEGAYSLLVDNNTVTNSGDEGILILSGDSFPFFDRDDREFERSAFLVGDSGGIYSEIPDQLAVITNNTVTSSGANGLHVKGAGHDDVVVAGNTFTDNGGLDEEGELLGAGARFESGRIDISSLENPNRFINTTDLPAVGLQFENAEGISPSQLTIVDETLGGSIFEGFAPEGSFYVRFEDGAILRDDNSVIVIDGTDASFDGVVPRSFSGELLPPSLLSFIEERLYDADDDSVNGRGQIFVGNPLLDGFTIANFQDFIRLLDTLGFGSSGLNLTVTGLPRVDLGPAALAAITPFAGGEDEELANIEPAAGDDAASLQDIEPAAGGEQVGCWGDAITNAEGGSIVSFEFGGTFEQSLADAAACGSDTI